MGPVARQGPREKLFAFGGFVTAWDVISAQGAPWKEKRKKAVDYHEFSTFSTDFSTRVFHNGISLWKNGEDDIIFLQWNRPKATFWGNWHFDMAGIFVKNMGVDRKPSPRRGWTGQSPGRVWGGGWKGAYTAPLPALRGDLPPGEGQEKRFFSKKG